MILGPEVKRKFVEKIWKIKNNFTLLEIVLCVAILSVAAVTLSWQMKGMLMAHHFNQNVDNFLTDLRKCQLIALSDRVDIEMRIEKKDDTYLYSLHCDDPIPCFIKKPMKLSGVEQIKRNKKPIDQHILIIHSSGRISPIDDISLFQNEDRGVTFKLKKSPLIELKRVDS
ncbi:MAG: hypothetical protein K940chlam6_01294 [Chlamydiae bacterium]|nr:hypothetical protein [Chlamydiota bacterium]